ncbi:heterokaryon incompatibility protein-domain-containing protein [Hypoxylon cercidicola]|nr:heterokaryon incompatibility protein-domain-containing protein [Hypoxylon cercidicola]
MRLINCRELRLEEFIGQNIPDYAILSHTWDSDEISFADFAQGQSARKGWTKITQTCKLAIEHDFNYAWIDTCCINKSSSAELTEAINSMYTWYAASRVCFAYLSDFDASNRESSFFSSRWFTRGWTLQELIAPRLLQFYDSSWKLYGSKEKLSGNIAQVTGIDEQVLKQLELRTNLQELLDAIPVSRKMSWASNRQTTRTEDIAYCLLGIFRVNMSLIYGEGEQAFVRLQKEIISRTNDLTILAWKTETETMPWDHFSILAPSPKEFSNSGSIVLSQDLKYNPDFTITNKGIQITAALPIHRSMEMPILSLHCHHRDTPDKPLGIYLGNIGGGVYSRATPNLIATEKAGARSSEVSVFLSIHKQRAGNPAQSALFQGQNFQFKTTVSPLFPWNATFEHMSTYPEKRWDKEFGFRAKDTQAFVGMNTYRVEWPNDTLEFVVACGFGPGIEPWVCINNHGSELWYAANDRDSLRVGEMGSKSQNEHIVLQSRMQRARIYVDVEIRPFYGGHNEPRWMQVEVRVNRKRKLFRIRHKRRHQIASQYLEGYLEGSTSQKLLT